VARRAFRASTALAVFLAAGAGRAQDAAVPPVQAAPVSTAEAGEDPSLWREEWPEFSVVEGLLTIAAGVGTLVLFAVGPVTEPRWRGGILFDDAVRSAVRAEDPSHRNTLALVGDATYYAAPIIPFVVDTVVVSLLAKSDAKLAKNLALVSLEAFSYAGVLSFAATQISARERPFVTQCLDDEGGDESRCELESRTEAFWSGHTTISAASAGLVCANHMHIALWGHRAADAMACGVASALAATTGVTRLVADQHYATDVIAGGAVGFTIGYAVPTLLHYAAAKPAPRMALTPVLSSGVTGLGMAGSF
jgi:membrane-associated phospholipid phosphatase